MKTLSLLPVVLILISCHSKERVLPCHEFPAPSNWICDEYLSYNFCAPPGSVHKISGGIYKGGSKISYDTDDFLTEPFPDVLSLEEENHLDNYIQICDDGNLIGVFYYGPVHLIDAGPNLGVLYLNVLDDERYFLTSYVEMPDDKVADIVDIAQCISKN